MTAASVEEPEQIVSYSSKTKADPCIASGAETSKIPMASIENGMQVSVESQTSSRLAGIGQNDPFNQSEADVILPFELVDNFPSADEEHGPAKAGEIVAELQTSETKTEAEAPVRKQTPTSAKKLSAVEKRRQRHMTSIMPTNVEERMPIASAGSTGKDDPFKQKAWTLESPMTASTDESNDLWYRGFVEWGDEDRLMEQTAAASEADPINHFEEEQTQEGSDIYISLRPSHSKPELDRRTIEQRPASSRDVEKAAITFVVKDVQQITQTLQPSLLDDEQEVQTPYNVTRRPDDEQGSDDAPTQRDEEGQARQESKAEVKVQKKNRYRITVTSNQKEDAVKKYTEAKAIVAQSLPKDTSTPVLGNSIPSQWNEPQEQAVAKSSEFEDQTKGFSYDGKTPNRHNITNLRVEVETPKKQFTPLRFEDDDESDLSLLELHNIDSQQTKTESPDEKVASPKRLFQEADELVPRGPKVQNHADISEDDIFDFGSLTIEHEIVSEKDKDDLILLESSDIDLQQIESHDEMVAKKLFQADELVPCEPKVQTYAGSSISNFESLKNEHEIVSDTSAWAKSTDEWNNFGDDNAVLEESDDQPKSVWTMFAGAARFPAKNSPTAVSQFRH
jgi:hypothetical protein